MSELTITNLTFSPSGTPVVAGRNLYVAFQQGTQVHSTGVSVTGTFNEHVNFRNAQLQDENAQMLITVCNHKPPESPEVVGQTVISVRQLLSSNGVQSFPVFDYSGQCTGSVGFRCSPHHNFSSGTADQPVSTAGAGRTAYPAPPSANTSAGTTAYPTPAGGAPATTSVPGIATGTGIPSAPAAAGAGALPNQPVRKPGLLDQARVGLVETLSSLHRGLENTKAQLAGTHHRADTTPGTAAAAGAGRTQPVSGSLPTAPPPGQSYQSKELPQSMLQHTKALLTDIASYTQYGLEKAKVAIAPKPAAPAP